MIERSITGHFAHWAHSLDLEDIPHEVVRQARRAQLDPIGVICAGARHDVTQTTRHGFLSQDQGSCSVTGGGKSTAGTAALVNGVAAHAYDFDDASHTGIMHGSAIIIPAVLAVMEEVEATDAQALAAIVAGSEISYTLADALTHRHYVRGWWSTATVSIIGATAATAKLYGLTADGIEHAIALAAASAGGSRSIVGYDAKPFLCGYVARNAVELACAAGAGICGPPDVFESDHGFFSLLNDRFQDPAQFDTLGSKWRLVEPGLLFKRYPVCSSALAGIEQSVLLRQDYKFEIDEIAELRCYVPELVANALIFDDPQTIQQAQFSLPFCIACALHYRDFGLEHLSPTVLSDPDVRATMAKVSKITDPDLCTEEMRMKFPECTRIEIRLNNGTVLDGTCLSAQGMPSRPLTDDNLAKKFRACATFANLETPEIDEAIAALMNSGLNSELRPGSKSRGHETRALLEKLWSGD